MKKTIIIISSIALLAACTQDKKAELEKLKKKDADLKTQIDSLETQIARADTTKKIVPTTAVSVVALKPEVFKNYIDVLGAVEADENVSISSEMPGTITKINVKVGNEVNKGDVLAETDARGITQQISDLQTNADLVNQIYQRQKNLWEQKIGTEVQYLQAKTNKESMEKKMAALQEQLRMSKIISPISGTVDAVDIKLGQIASPGMPSIRVINFANLKVKADVAESYASKIKKGSDVIVRFPDTNDTLLAKVNFVSRAINANTRSLTVEVLLDNNKDYHPNMATRLNINDYQSATPVIIVPVRTIQKDENNAPFVFVAEGNIAKKHLITIGKEYGGRSEIITGLKEGDKLVTLGYDLINDGTALTINK